MKHSRLFMQQGTASYTSRATVLALVVALHWVLLSHWLKQPVGVQAALNEMSVSLAFAPPVSKTAYSQARSAVIPAAQPAAEQLAPAGVSPPAGLASAATARPLEPLADSEPGYQAAYLNNPQPAYPLLARRNGLQGRVVLHVEVLAGGRCGQINIHTSSGYAILDNAALETVKTWHFMAARQAGMAVDKWFMIPVQFSLKDNAA